MGWLSAPEYWLGRLILERGTAVVYVFAFVAAARQFRHFLVVVLLLLLLDLAPRNIARRARRGIGENITDLRARRRRKRDREAGDKGRKNGQDEGSEHLAVGL